MERVDFFNLSRTIEVGYDGQKMKLAEALDASVDDGAKAVLRCGRKAKISLTIEVELEGANQLEVTAGIKVNLPQPNTGTVTVFSSRRGELSFDDAEQGKLPELQAVGGERE